MSLKGLRLIKDSLFISHIHVHHNAELTVWQSQLKAHELLIPHSFSVNWTHTEEPMASAQIAVGVLVPLQRKTLLWGGSVVKAGVIPLCTSTCTQCCFPKIQSLVLEGWKEGQDLLNNLPGIAM